MVFQWIEIFDLSNKADEGISTLEPDAELRLSIMGSIAQEESRKTSSRVKWGQQRQMERGVVFGRSMLGYDVKDGRMTINPEGAELQLNLLPQKWRFVLDSIADIRHLSGAGCHLDPSVPISVSRPFSSSKGME